MLVSQGHMLLESLQLAICKHEEGTPLRAPSALPCFAALTARARLLGPVLLQGLCLVIQALMEMCRSCLAFSAGSERVPQLFEPSSLCFSCCFLCMQQLCLLACLHISLLPTPACHRALCPARSCAVSCQGSPWCAGSCATAAIPLGQEPPG